jgi:hypothetical protein
MKEIGVWFKAHPHLLESPPNQILGPASLGDALSGILMTRDGLAIHPPAFHHWPIPLAWASIFNWLG